MKKILSIIIINILLICSFSVQGFSKHNNDTTTHVSPGDYFRFINVDGKLRSYRIHIPPSYDDSNPMPVVFSLHGSAFPAVNSFTQEHYYASDMDQKADEEGFIVVYPNGGFFLYRYLIDYPFYLSFFELLPLLTLSRVWNFGNYSNVDDVGFIKSLINNLIKQLKVDSSRIYITGLSNSMQALFYLDARWNSEYRTQTLGRDPLGRTDNQAYAVFNGRISFGSESEHWSIDLWGQNLTDEQYFVGAFQPPLQNSYIVYPNEPNTYGVTIRARH